MRLTSVMVVTLICVAAPSIAQAQQSYHNVSAAQPSPGVTLARQTYRYRHYDRDPLGFGREVHDFEVSTQIAHGLTKDLTFIVTLPVMYRELERDSMSDDRAFGLGDTVAMIKYRLWQHDSGPIDTVRMSALAGLDLPTGTDHFGNEGFDPLFGIVLTTIQGRHGANAAARYKFNTNERDSYLTPGESIDDILYLDVAYLYRIAPATFSGDSHGAWYAMAELNGTYETNGDIEAIFAPGIMYEATKWVFEATLQLPVYENVDHRPRFDWGVGLGVRMLF